MSSEIDPQVHHLANVVRYQLLAAQEGDDERFEHCSRKWDELARAITARLRTPGMVEISRAAAMHIGHFMRDASHFEVEFDQWALVEIDYELAKEEA